MGWNAIKTVAGAVAILTSVGVGVGIAPAHADEQSYFDALRAEGFDQYMTPDTALQIGNWYCKQLRDGRTLRVRVS